MTFIAICKHHGEAKFRIDNKGSRRCTKCDYMHMRNRQLRVKQILIEEHGGACVCCGYNICIQALEFHHVDPYTKEFGISSNSRFIAIEKLRVEAEKCILVCANCHVEIERGYRKCPPIGSKWTRTKIRLVNKQ